MQGSTNLVIRSKAPARPPREPQPRDDGCSRSINACYGAMRGDPQPRDPGNGRFARANGLGPNPRDPPGGYSIILDGGDPHPRDPPNGYIVFSGNESTPRDPRTSPCFASGPQPRDDGKNRQFSRRQRLARDPQPRDPGN